MRIGAARTGGAPFSYDACNDFSINLLKAWCIKSATV